MFSARYDQEIKILTKKNGVWQSIMWEDIVSNPKYDGYQCGLASIFHKTFDKKDADTITQTGTGISVNLRISQWNR